MVLKEKIILSIWLRLNRSQLFSSHFMDSIYEDHNANKT